MSQDAFKVTVRGPEHVDATELIELGSDDFVARLPAQVPGEHHWVVGLIHAIDDPELALDNMTLGGETLLGFYPIHCLFCMTAYRDLQEHGLPPCAGADSLRAHI